MVGSSAFSWAWNNALRLLFPLTLPWVPLFLSADFFYNAVPEGRWLHSIIEDFLVPAFLVASIIFSILLYRLWPGFLRVQGRVSVWFIFTRIIVNTFLVYIILTVVTVLVSLLIDPPPWKSDNPQYIPMVFFTVFFYPPLFTPLFALIAIWRSILVKARESLQKG
ncbi:MAG TPA: hypothetical protein ENK96_08650 [Desulfobulbaceae bacterium]|nr:hypothetical protein [Desulfobulbaceae bacterium]